LLTVPVIRTVEFYEYARVEKSQIEHVTAERVLELVRSVA
jgi:hypothetical protein